jgi:hypothetical protein
MLGSVPSRAVEGYGHYLAVAPWTGTVVRQLVDAIRDRSP